MQDEAGAAAELQQGGQRRARTSIDRRNIKSVTELRARVVRLVRCDDRNDGSVDGSPKTATHTPECHDLRTVASEQSALKPAK